MMTEFRKLFFKNTAVLTLTAIIIRILGLAFRVFMVTKIGSEGIGVYQLVLTVYMLAVTVSTSGITLSVTRIVTDSQALGNEQKTRSTVRACMLIGIVISTICSLFMYCFADEIGNVFLNEGRAVLSLKVLSPSLPFMAVSACFRGYFYAKRSASKAAFEQLLEQIIEISIFMMLIDSFIEKGIEYACCAVALGTLLAEVISCIYSYICYKLDTRTLTKNEHALPQGFRKTLLSIFLPVTGSACLRSGLSSVENTMIPTGLRKYGCDLKKSLSDYGIITGMVMPVLTFPFVLLYSIAMLIIPEISQANAVNHKISVRSMCLKAYNVTLIFAIPVTVLFAVLGEKIGICIYNSRECGIYISMLAPTVLLMYTDSITDGILKGLNDQFRYFAYNLIDSIIRVILTFFLIPLYGIKGMIIVIFVSEILNTSLSVVRLIKVIKMKIDIKNSIIKPILGSLCALLAVTAFLKLADIGNVTLELITAVLVFTATYILYMTLNTLKTLIRKSLNIM